MELLVKYVAAHNRGVRSGDFRALADLLHPTATMRFDGIDAGPFDSADAILRAFRDSPPDDELTIGPCRKIGPTTIEATYGWARDRGRMGGRLRVTTERGRISAIFVGALGAAG